MLKITPNSTFEALSNTEWLVANGIGGFASSTITGANTRRYHGLLTAALEPPTGRMVVVSKVEECILFGRDCAFSLSSNRYNGVIHPEGYQHLRFFERKPLPRMKFEVNGYNLLKTIFMPHGSNTTVVEYENTGENPFRLRLSPLFVYRDYHTLFRREDRFDFYTNEKGGYFEMYPHFGAQPVFFRHTVGEYRQQPVWYYNFTYERETERGLDDREDAYSPAQIEIMLRPGEKAHLIFSTEEAMMKADPEQLKSAELLRLQSITADMPDDSFIQDLLLAGDQFVVKRTQTGGYTLIAGYPWFTDWGRDTMIALRGLSIAPGRKDVAASILRTFLEHVDKGMLPNRFPDQGEQPEYNTIDATLWLFVALYEYYQKFWDHALIEEIFDQLTAIINMHIEGTRYGIGVTPEGFLRGGEGLAQLTWMDARVGDFVVTPRHGCPVEIQALWYNTLRVYQYFAGTLKRSYKTYADLADRLQGNFKKYFQHTDGSLYDVVVPGISADKSVRPNQIYVVSLPFSLLGKDEEKRVVALVRDRLLTLYGLRTLATDNPAFAPSYTGTPWQRDTAYHQGTVWPFLLGEYATALLKINDWSDAAQKEVRQLLEPLKAHFYHDNCLHGISEVFDGLNPRTGKGAIHQAWSVGALLKTMYHLRDLAQKPKDRPPKFIPSTMLIF